MKTVLLALTVAVAANAAAAQAQTAQEIAKTAFNSTVLLVMEDANGQPLSFGSGFFVRSGEIVTNFHVIEDAAGGYAKLIGEETTFDIEGTTGVDHKRDLVVLKVSATDTTPLPLGNSDAIQVGEVVYAVGSPRGLEGTFSQGILSGIREVNADVLLQITAPISPGSSGGPVLNANAEVIGVSVATFEGGQNLNFAIPSAYVKKLLESTGPVKPLKQASSAKQKSSILSNFGERSVDGVVGKAFTWADGYHADDIDYSFTLVNKLREPVKNISYLIIFFDKDGDPIDFKSGEKDWGVIPARLGVRIQSSSYDGVHVSVVNLAERIEIRVLGFEIVQ